MRLQLGMGPWVLWGESAGAVVSLIATLRAPQALRGLILAYMGPSGQRIIADPRSVLSPQHPSYRPLRAAEGDASPQHPAILSPVEPLLAAAAWTPFGEQWLLTQDDRALIVCPDGAPRVWAAFEQFVTDFEVQAQVGEIGVPALVVAGQHDPLVPLVHVEHLGAGLPHAEVVVLADSGHGDVDPRSADGARYQAAVRHFLERLPAPTAAQAR